MKRYKSPLGRQLIFESYDKLLDDWGVSIKEKDIETTYGHTHIIKAGDPQNPPLLLLHGTADNSAMMWIYNIEQLSEHFYVIAVDAIGGSGKSEPNEQYYKSFNQITWIDEILDVLKIGKTNICGVSYGAFLAYYYTLNRPNRINKAICLAGGIPAGQFEVFTKMMAAFLPEAMFPTEKSCKKLLRKLCGANYQSFENNELLMKHWYYLLKYFNNESMMQHKINIDNNMDLSDTRSKALFIIGEQDRLSHYPKAIKRLVDYDMNYKIIKDAGHAINHEQPSLINKEIMEHIL